MDEYEGGWMTTYTGKKFHFLNPQQEEIDVRDIAHHLSLLCRFTGACKTFYSVADHSIRVAKILPKELKLAGLLHDAAEAYINDISRPVKHSHKLEETEKKLEEAIGKRFEIDIYNPEIKQADDILVATEARDLMPNMDDWASLPEPLEEKIVPINSALAELAFLEHFNRYMMARYTS